jgi:site-specific DNA-methyltransferase (adenine-specific)
MLLNEDCFKAMESIEDNSVDLILTDPPYGIDYRLNITKNEDKLFSKILNDKPNDIDWDRFFSESHRILRPGKCLYLFGRLDFFLRISVPIRSSRLKYNHDFIWSKGDMGSGNLNVFGSIHETIICLSKGNAEKSRIVTIDGEHKKRSKAFYVGKISTKEYVGHPTQKPIGLLAYIIENRTDPNDLVFDPFNGSGSTTFAADLLQRKWIGCELSQEYHEVASRRMKNEELRNYHQRQLEGGYVTRDSGISIRTVGR